MRSWRAKVEWNYEKKLLVMMAAIPGFVQAFRLPDVLAEGDRADGVSHELAKLRMIQCLTSLREPFTERDGFVTEHHYVDEHGTDFGRQCAFSSTLHVILEPDEIAVLPRPV